MMNLKAFLLLILIPIATMGQAADRDKIVAFMEVTGFDVALDSLRLSAKNAPAMIGLDASDFGVSWTRVADDVFASDALQQDAIDILEQTLSDDVLAHAAAFYASDLGQRLVAAENASHMADDAEKDQIGAEMAAKLFERGSQQPQYFKDMADAIGTIDQSIAAFREVQVRFILAASAAGLIDQRFDEAELRALLASQDPEIRAAIDANMLSSNAYTYRGFSDADMLAYLKALQTPEMKEVYELMNAVQYTLQADRYERLAARMAELHPSQEL